MLKAKFLLFLLITTRVLIAQNKTELYAWASNGLNLRESANANSTIKRKLAPGTKVFLLDTASNIMISDTLSKGDPIPIVIHGFWVKIQVDTSIGYVFSGYLSRFKPQYISELFDGINPVICDTTTFDEGKRFDRYCKRYTREDGSWCEEGSMEGCTFDGYFISGGTFNDAIMFMCVSFPPDKYCPIRLMKVIKANYMLVTCDASEREIEIRKDGFYLSISGCD